MAIKQLATLGSYLNSGLGKEYLQNPGKMGQILLIQSAGSKCELTEN